MARDLRGLEGAVNDNFVGRADLPAMEAMWAALWVGVVAFGHCAGRPRRPPAIARYRGDAILP